MSYNIQDYYELPDGTWRKKMRQMEIVGVDDLWVEVIVVMMEDLSQEAYWRYKDGEWENCEGVFTPTDNSKRERLEQLYQERKKKEYEKEASFWMNVAEMFRYPKGK